MNTIRKIQDLYEALDKLKGAEWYLDKHEGNKTIKENLQYLIDDTQQAIKQEQENLK